MWLRHHLLGSQVRWLQAFLAMGTLEGNQKTEGEATVSPLSTCSAISIMALSLV